MYVIMRGYTVGSNLNDYSVSLHYTCIYQRFYVSSRSVEYPGWEDQLQEVDLLPSPSVYTTKVHVHVHVYACVLSLTPGRPFCLLILSLRRILPFSISGEGRRTPASSCMKSMGVRDVKSSTSSANPTTMEPLLTLYQPMTHICVMSSHKPI